MGFKVEIAILFPESEWSPGVEPSNRIKVWRPYFKIDLGHLTRVAKLSISHLVERFTPFERAGICFMSVVFENHSAKIGLAQHEVIAPRFLVYSEDDFAEPSRETFDRLRAKNIREVIDLGPRQTYDHFVSRSKYIYPGESEMKEHNVLHECDDEMLKYTLAHSHPALQRAPLRWDSAANIADWMKDAQMRNNEEWQEVSKTPVSLALYHGLQTQLREFAAVDAHVLFIFP